MTLPLLLSVPHAGLRVPPEVEGLCVLTPEEVAAHGDVGARAVYALAEHVCAFETSEVARAVVDLNRAADDFRKDGVIKTHTCWDVPVYREPLGPALMRTLLARYYRPYHARLSAHAHTVVAGIDSHTMAPHGPPVGPDAGEERPRVCLGNDHGRTFPGEWLRSLSDCLKQALGTRPSLNEPFAGGYITRTHGREMPWVQLEVSRAPFVENHEKRERILAALTDWCDYVGR